MIPKSYWWVLTAIIKKYIFLEKKKYLNMLYLISSTHLHLKQTKPTRKSAPCLFTWVNLRFLRTFKGSQLGTLCPYAIVYCYLEYKLRYLKNLKLFSIRVKELFEPIVLPKKKGDGFLLFLKAFSWEIDFWVKLGDFAVKNTKLGREICIYLKID